MLDGALDSLLELLDLEEVGQHSYVGHSPAGRDRRVYGGQLLAQALIAAQRSTDDALVTRSLHAYFVHPDDPSEPILYQVTTTPTADGSFAGVRAVQQQQTLCMLDAVLSDSYVPGPTGAPLIGTPDDAPTPADVVELMRRRSILPSGDWFTRPRPLERRYVEDVWTKNGVPPQHNAAWFRGIGTAPDDARINDEPRPRDVVSSAVSCRRLASLRTGQPGRGRRSRLHAWRDVEPRRSRRCDGHAGDFDEAARSRPLAPS